MLPMSQELIWPVLKQSVLMVLPEFDRVELTPEMSLQALGANSVDRVEVIMLTLSQLQKKIPLTAFALTNNMSEIMDVICANGLS